MAKRTKDAISLMRDIKRKTRRKFSLEEKIRIVLDDCSRYIIAWELCSTMTASDGKMTLDLALETGRIKTGCKPKLLSDNGPCYIGGELTDYLDEHGMKHIRGRPLHPQTQGTIERYHRTMKNLPVGRQVSSSWKTTTVLMSYVTDLQNLLSTTITIGITSLLIILHLVTPVYRQVDVLRQERKTIIGKRRNYTYNIKKTKNKLIFNYPKMYNLTLRTFSPLSFDDLQAINPRKSGNALQICDISRLLPLIYCTFAVNIINQTVGKSIGLE